MIFHFPRLDTLSFAIAGGHIPATTASAPCRASFASNGVIAVEASFKLAKGRKAELLALGVTESDHHLGAIEELTCWLQAFPLQPVAGPPQVSQQAPILFELPDAAVMAEIVQEILRLGNDRQSFRAVAGANGTTRILLRVIGPPYYTLLRATERFEGNDQPIRAFVEPSPRVWVEIGYTHPFASRITLAENRVLFLSAPRSWDAVPDAPFRDIYELLQFPLPHAPVAWADAGPGETITVPLRLAAGTATDVPEFWVLPESEFTALDAFVRDVDERLLRRLRFAVAESPDGVKRFALSVTPSKQAPPALAIPNTVGYKPYWNLPNLFVPAGQRLHPPLRRETVRRLLADDRDRATWLAPDGKGGFTPYSVPFDAFRPLEDWVNYIIDANAEPIAEWIAATMFDFDSFICVEAPPKSGGGKGGGRPAKKPVDETLVAKKPEPQPPPSPGKSVSFEVPISGSVTEAVRTPSEWELRRTELEAAFLGNGTGPIDSPTRAALWSDLAESYVALGTREDAALAFWNAMAANPLEADAIAAKWITAEQAVPFDRATLDQWLSAEPTKESLRAVAAAVYALAGRPEMKAQWPAVQQFLAQHDSLLPVRGAWIVAMKLARETGADSLGLARTRDRLLARLYEGGLNPERDLPVFLRYAGANNTERMRVIREKALSLHATVRTWVESGLSAGPAHANGDTIHTPAFVDLAFAFAFARIQDSDTTKQLIRKAAIALSHPTDSGNPFRTRVVPIIADSYLYRIEQAHEGKPHAGPVSPELRQRLELLESDAMAEKSSRTASGFATAGSTHHTLEYSNHGLLRYLEFSRILNPQERSDAYGIWKINGDPFKEALWQLHRIARPDELARQIRLLLTRGVGKQTPTPESRFAILHVAVPLSGRVSEAFAVELLSLVPDILATGNALAEGSQVQGQLLERSLVVAAHYDRRELVSTLIDRLLELVRTKKDDQRHHLINAIGGSCLRSLRKFDQSDAVMRLLNNLRSEILKGLSPAEWFARMNGQKSKDRAEGLQTALTLAACWYTFGDELWADEVVAVAERELFAAHTTLMPLDFANVLQATISALATAPPESGLTRIESFFTRIASGRFVHPLSTAPYYSRLHLIITEAVVMALASDESLGELGGRRWRDDEEYLIRRRIHADVRAMCGTA